MTQQYQANCPTCGSPDSVEIPPRFSQAPKRRLSDFSCLGEEGTRSSYGARTVGTSGDAPKPLKYLAPTDPSK